MKLSERIAGAMFSVVGGERLPPLKQVPKWARPCDPRVRLGGLLRRNLVVGSVGAASAGALTYRIVGPSPKPIIIGAAVGGLVAEILWITLYETTGNRNVRLCVPPRDYDRRAKRNRFRD